MNKKNKKGSILYFSVLLVGILFSLGAVITTTLIQRIQMIEELSYSVNAFYAADAGIEKVLYRWNDITNTSTIINYNTEQGSNLLPEQSYVITKRTDDIDGNPSLIITSSGNFKGVKRAIQISRPIN